ncbi:MAG: protocatechuate 3,4-dioxygenase subunit beta, partial [Mesorhizobium sp.]
RHKKDGYLAPLDPNFGGCGRTLTGEDGAYAFRTVRPGPYPWPNGPNDWRPAHIHFSVFGHGFAQRLITQMYFEGDPLIWRCPIVGGIRDKAAVEALIAALDMQSTIPMDALAYKFDIVLRGRRSTLFENRPEGN